LVDKKGPFLEIRWFLGSAIKSWQRAGLYPDARKQKDAAPQAKEGVPEKKEKQMRRTIALLTTMVLTLLVATSVAMADVYVTKTCSYSGNCYGTSANDILHGGEGNNKIYGYRGNDGLFGNSGEDDLYGDSGGGPNGGPFNNGGDDYINGGSGFDRLYGGSGDDHMYDGGDGPDLFVGGGGNDFMVSQDKFRSNIYRFDFRPQLDILTVIPSGSDQVTDSGGTNDILWWISNTTRAAVTITWVDTSDADVFRDALRIRDKSVPSQTVLVYNYFNNLGGTGKGSGAIEFLHFADKSVGFPAAQG
jgi:Ca2+-binding RTX toxin-like protein